MAGAAKRSWNYSSLDWGFWEKPRLSSWVVKGTRGENGMGMTSRLPRANCYRARIVDVLAMFSPSCQHWEADRAEAGGVPNASSFQFPHSPV